MINSFLYTVISSIVAFLGTNLDDLLILMIFFSQVNRDFRKRHIIIGQFIGFSVLIFIILVATCGTFLVSEKLIGFLGFIPIVFGVKKIIDLNKNKSELEKIRGITLENKKSKILIEILKSPYTYTVATVTVGNCGDNISIYVPLLARRTLVEIYITLLVFYLFCGVWCYLGYKLAKNNIIYSILIRYKDISEIIVFIGLGLFIVIKSNALLWS